MDRWTTGRLSRILELVRPGRNPEGVPRLLMEERKQPVISPLSHLIVLRCWIMLMLVGVIAASCRTAGPPLPQLDLGEPDWKIHQGQAVWRPAGGKPEIAGEVVVATSGDGRTFVQFSKPPFPLVVGQTDREHWQLAIAAQTKLYSGQGPPPKRAIWLWLPLAVAGTKPPPGLTWQTNDEGWRLKNDQSGECLEGYFSK